MDEARRIIIRHADGREFSVARADYDAAPADAAGRTYQQLGFRIVRWEDGAAYHGPSDPAPAPDPVRLAPPPDPTADNDARNLPADDPGDDGGDEPAARRRRGA